MSEQTSGFQNAMSKPRYFEQERAKLEAPAKQAVHSEFLRTGRIDRTRPSWAPDEKRYLSYEEVAERTGRFLVAAGEKTHERLNSFHRSIQFPKLIFHRTLSGTPHLGYCHVTAAKSKFAEYDEVKWAFYIANFFAEIGSQNMNFERINMRVERMYFAVAVENGTADKKLTINTAVRGNGILFRTHDPKTALKNVLMLGAKHDAIRTIIKAI